MIELETTEVTGWESAIRGMRNPLNSWSKSDSGYCDIEECEEEAVYDGTDTAYVVGTNDLSLMKKLAKAGTDHAKYRRMITVYADINAPLYWWKEYDTYKVGTVANSCSTMHKIQDKEFTLDDFSHEHLLDVQQNPLCSDKYYTMVNPIRAMECIVDCLNVFREYYIKTNDKQYWWQMIQLLPSSYNQRRTVMLNYEVLANIYHSRKTHKLDEWVNFCKWIETLPYSEVITDEKE